MPAGSPSSSAAAADLRQRLRSHVIGKRKGTLALVNAMNIPGQRRALVLIAGAQLLALSLWFSASAVSGSLKVAWGLSDAQIPWLTLTVQIGFVVGAVVSALANLADRIPARYLFATAAVFGALVNGSLVLLGSGVFGIVVVVRFLTGVALAGVYPSGMKAIAGWFRESRGTALGILIGALTVGSALPHLIRGIGVDWRVVLASASVLAIVGSLMMLAAGDGPYEVGTSAFSWSHVRSIVGNRGFRLATVGYLGHMWELYAAWTWVAAYVAASSFTGSASVAAFAMIAIGGVGSWIAGRLADAKGRTLAAGGSMVISGTAAALTAVVFDAPGWVLMAVLLIWGMTIVSDSAQFSAIVTEVVDPGVRGTALTLQTAVGFLLTLVTIWLVPNIADATSWRWAFLVLVPGPVVGTIAMIRLKQSDWSRQLAGGRG
jgi:MFS family permease